MTKPNHFLRSPSAVGGRRGAESLAAFTPPGRRPRDPGGAVAAAAHRAPAPVLAALTFALGLVVAAPPLAASAQGQNLSMELSVSAPQCRVVLVLCRRAAERLFSLDHPCAYDSQRDSDNACQ